MERTNESALKGNESKRGKKASNTIAPDNKNIFTVNRSDCWNALNSWINFHFYCRIIYYGNASPGTTNAKLITYIHPQHYP